MTRSLLVPRCFPSGRHFQHCHEKIARLSTVACCARPCPSGNRVLFLHYVSGISAFYHLESTCCSQEGMNKTLHWACTWKTLTFHIGLHSLHYEVIKAMARWRWLTTTLRSSEGPFCLPALREFPSGFLHPLIYPQLLAKIDLCLIVDWTEHAAVLDLILNTQAGHFPVKAWSAAYQHVFYLRNVYSDASLWNSGIPLALLADYEKD